MTPTIQKEIQRIMEYLHYDFPISEFEEKAKWWDVCSVPNLSEEFIEYYDEKGKISWLAMSKFQAVNFSEEFFEKNRYRISVCKMLSVN